MGQTYLNFVLVAGVDQSSVSVKVMNAEIVRLGGFLLLLGCFLFFFRLRALFSCMCLGPRLRQTGDLREDLWRAFIFHAIETGVSAWLQPEWTPFSTDRSNLFVASGWFY
jgi:hypothetical protein